MKFKLSLFASVVFAIAIIATVSSAQRKPDADKPISGDFKITIKQTVSGQTMQSTTLIKGQRERSETSITAGMNMVTITQCDLRRTLQINDGTRKYLIKPMDDGASTGSTPSAAGASMPTTRGGVVNMTVNTIDTGERKEILGYTARHLKRTTIMESSPDACSQQKMKIETDGWYINLEYGLSCPANRSGYSGGAGSSGGCRDRYVYKTNGPTHLGFPLQETSTMYGPDGSVTMAVTREVVEISRQPLDVALFDIPAGYTEAKDQQEMYMPSASDLMATAPQQAQAESPTQTQTSAAAARVRVGVVQFNNKTKTQTATDSLQQQLVAALTSRGIDAVALNAISPGEAVAEARAKQVSYILYTDIATLKAPSTGKKLGGMLGRATGIGSADTGKAEAKLDFRLVPTGGTSPAAQSSISAKEETADVSLSAAIRDEAQAVASAIPHP